MLKDTEQKNGVQQNDYTLRQFVNVNVDINVNVNVNVNFNVNVNVVLHNTQECHI